MPGQVTAAFADGVAVLTLENPGRLNALDDGVAAGLAAGVAAARERGDIGALVLRGAGRDAFCSGVDLKFAAELGDRGKAFARVGVHMEKFHAAMADLPFPSIALVHGVCYGGGVHLAVTCDFRFADTSLRMVVPALKSGLLYPIPAVERLMRLIGPARTRRMLLEGKVIAPQTLCDWSLVDEVHAPDALEGKTLEFARHLASQPRAVVPDFLRILRAVEAGDSARANAIRDAARRPA